MIIVWIVLGVVALLVVLFILAWLNAIRASIACHRRLQGIIRPAIEAVEGNHPSAQDIICNLAERPAARNVLYAKLKEMGKADLFPAACRSAENIAESDLARWLMHPNELAAPPAEMELVRTIAVEDKERRGSMYLFKFRTDPPHWASGNGWMAGVAGPYWDNEESPDVAIGTFSELKAFDSMTEEQHVEYLQKALNRKGLVVPTPANIG